MSKVWCDVRLPPPPFVLSTKVLLILTVVATVIVIPEWRAGWLNGPAGYFLRGAMITCWVCMLVVLGTDYLRRKNRP
jgi:hypothetical protein